MKQLLPALGLLAAGTTAAQQLPTLSPRGTVEQIVGLTTVKVDYSRPSMRERRIFGELVPFGEVWRTGANKCTTIEFDGPVLVEGKVLEAGKYSLFTVPTKDLWLFIFNRNTELWGEADRKQEEDVLTVKAIPAQTTDPTETFTIGFESVKDDRARLELRWEHVRVGIELFADATEKGLANIREAMAKPDVDHSGYNRSARFCVDRNVMLADALRWAEKSVAMEKKYWNTHTLALAQAKNGKYKEAIATAELSLKLAQEAKSDSYVKMNQDRIAEWTAALKRVAPEKGGRARD